MTIYNFTYDREKTMDRVMLGNGCPTAARLIVPLSHRQGIISKENLTQPTIYLLIAKLSINLVKILDNFMIHSSTVPTQPPTPAKVVSLGLHLDY